MDASDNIVDSLALTSASLGISSDKATVLPSVKIRICNKMYIISKSGKVCQPEKSSQ